MAELTSSTREAARRLGVSDTTMHKAERTGRIAREPNGQWDIAKLRVQMRETADPQRSALAGSAAAEGTPFARLAAVITFGTPRPPCSKKGWPAIPKIGISWH
jgi:hypothetical protein